MNANRIDHLLKRFAAIKYTIQKSIAATHPIVSE